MARRFRVIVVGVGGMGSAACWRLAERGAAVLGLEQFDIPHSSGSSHGSTRLVRQAYHEHPDYVPLLKRAYELWRELEQTSGQDLLTISGVLHLGHRGHQRLGAILETAHRHQIAVEQLDRRQVAERFPQFNIDDRFEGVFEPLGGFVPPEKTVAAQTLAALRAGAEIHAREPVREWRVEDGVVRVTTTRDSYEAERIVFCAGAWTARLLADLGAELVVTRQTLSWTWPHKPEAFILGRFPCWTLTEPDGVTFYGFPMVDDCPGLKTARHVAGLKVDPDHVPRQELPGDEAEVRSALARFLPDANGPLLALRTCLYTNSPDEHFIIDRHPEHASVVLACGFSGHGFKFAPVIGEILADLALEGSTPLPAQFLGLGRFL
jgi:sarcosine oxidase